MATWSIETELLAMSGATALDVAVSRLGLADEQGPFSLCEVEDWRRAGSEIYLYVFEVAGANAARRYAFRAFVPHPAASTVAEALGRYVQRAEQFRLAGGRVPMSYGWASGTLLQEWIESSLATALVSAPAPSAAALVSSALELRALVSVLGYEPITFFPDLMATGSQAVLVDLGTDLIQIGSRAATSADDILIECVSWLDQIGGRRRAELQAYVSQNLNHVLAVLDRGVAG